MSEPYSSTLSAQWEWRSANGRFGVVIKQRQVEQLLCLCTEAGGHETGGILIGRYNDGLDLAMVTRVSGPPPDSRAGRTFFERGTKGLQSLLNRLWRADPEYYLGEWHFHPGAEGIPSPVDLDQMQEITMSPSFRCPEPVLLIVGGWPAATWSIRAYVYPAGQQTELGTWAGQSAAT